jgi:membrane protein required for colicin V production
MTGFDYAVIAVVALSSLLAAWRGAVREAFHLAGWIAAFVAARGYAGALSAAVPGDFGYPALKLAGAFMVLFLAVLIGFGLLGLLVSKLVKTAGLGLADRMLGTFIGLARGVIIVVGVVLLAGLTSLPREPFWRDAMLSRPLELAALEVRPWLPADMASKIRYQ